MIRQDDDCEVCIRHDFRRKRSSQPLRSYAWTLLLQVLFFVNIAVLAIRVFNDYFRPKEDLQFILTYSLGVLTILTLLYIIIQAVRSRGWSKFHFLSTVIAVILFQAFFVYWRFYSF